MISKIIAYGGYKAQRCLSENDLTHKESLFGRIYGTAALLSLLLQTWQWNGNIDELYYEIVNPFVSRISAIGCKLYLGSNRRGKLVLRLRRQPICLKLLFQGGWYPFEMVTLSERPVLSVWILSIFPVRSCAKLCVSNSVLWMGDAYKLDVRNCTMRSH